MRRTLLPLVTVVALVGCAGDQPDGPTLEGTAPPVDGTLAPEADVQPGSVLAPEETLEPEVTLQPDTTSGLDTDAPR